MQKNFAKILFFILLIPFASKNSMAQVIGATEIKGLTEIKLDAQKDATVDIVITPILKNQISVQNGQLLFDPSRNKTLLLKQLINSIDGTFSLFIFDFNRDGYNDLLVETDRGYMGVNVFTNLYLYDSGKGSYSLALEGLVNPEWIPKKNEIRTWGKSGLEIVGALYRLNKGRFYPAEEYSENQGSALKKIVTKNPQGKIVDQALYYYDVVVTGGQKLRNPVFKIGSEKAPFYEKSKNKFGGTEFTETKSYLIKGDRVRLFDFYADYYLALYEKKNIKGWVFMRDLEWP